MNYCKRFVGAAVLAIVVSGGTRAHAGITVTPEAAGVQTSNVAGVTTETFESFAPGTYSSLVTAVGTLSSSGKFAIVSADLYGASGGMGNYFSVGNQSGSTDPVTLTLNAPTSYFGMWWSAADYYNTLTFYSGNTEVASFTTGSIYVPPTFTGSGPYYGNPNTTFLGQDSGEPFAYLNFNDSGGTFDKIVISNPGGTGFESDNWSVSSVPEPSSLILGLLGAVGAVGVAYRRRVSAK